MASPCLPTDPLKYQTVPTQKPALRPKLQIKQSPLSPKDCRHLGLPSMQCPGVGSVLRTTPPRWGHPGSQECKSPTFRARLSKIVPWAAAAETRAPDLHKVSPMGSNVLWGVAVGEYEDGTNKCVKKKKEKKPEFKILKNRVYWL